MTLENGLNTIELGSTAWRNIINMNFKELDKNRFFIVNLDADLPTIFKNNRFFLSLESSKIFYDDGTQLLSAGGGAGIEYENNANKFIKVNSTEDGLEYAELGNPLNNSAVGTHSISISQEISSNYIINLGKNNYDLLFNKNDKHESISIGYNTANNNEKNILIGSKSRCMTSTNAATSYPAICIGYNSKILSNNQSKPQNILIGSDSSISKGTGDNSHDYFPYTTQNILIGNNSRINQDNITKNIVIGHNNISSSPYVENQIIIGNDITNGQKNTINFNSISKDENSFNYKLTRQHTGGLCNRNSHVQKTAYVNSSSLTTDYKTSIKLEDNCVVSIDYKIIFKNTGYTINSTNNDKTAIIEGKIVCVIYANYSNFIIKEQTKNIIYKDPEYTNVDVNFTASYNELKPYINSSGIRSVVLIDYKINVFDSY